ncbi:hypothetical protein Taro_040448 [Colocasia esculenta]|uniref:Uncharacterized protein n=1 Tax=Colocasia esculenta TaxID=4460 RepID=A0A843WJ36_COLES|nr:hypothetical protein [Colocasia esculenta]
MHLNLKHLGHVAAYLLCFTLQLGRNKVFLRAGQIAILDSRRAAILDYSAKLIQCHLRMFLARKEFLGLRNAVMVVQAFCRGCLDRRLYVIKKQIAAAVVIQKYARRWLLQCYFKKVRISVVTIQSCIRGLSARMLSLSIKEQKAAMFIQAQWRMWKVHSAFLQYRQAVISIQCAWRQKVAKKELWRLKQAAKDAGALREAKNKLEKQLEDVSLHLELEKRRRVSSEAVKQGEILKLQQSLESLHADLSTAMLAIDNERHKNASLLSQLELSKKEKIALECRLSGMEKINKENLNLKSTVDTLTQKMTNVEQELLKAQKTSSATLEKLQHDTPLPTRLRSPYQKERFMKAIERHELTIETDSPVALISLSPFQGHHEFLAKCIKEDLGFKDGKPLAACIIYKFLLQTRAFEAEITTVFDGIIEGINDAIKVLVCFL